MTMVDSLAALWVVVAVLFAAVVWYGSKACAAADSVARAHERIEKRALRDDTEKLLGLIDADVTGIENWLESQGWEFRPASVREAGWVKKAKK